jgi:hypothetical protein
MVIGSRQLAVTHASRRRTWSVSWRTLALVGDIGTGQFITGSTVSNADCCRLPTENSIDPSVAEGCLSTEVAFPLLE